MLPKPHQYVFQDRSKAILLRDFSLDVRENFCFNITIKKGYIYNGFSIPYAFAWVQDRWGDYIVAALIHDMAYGSHFCKSRSQADWLFLVLLQMYGDNWVHRNALYSSVWSFGWTVYSKTEEEILKERKFLEIKPL